MSSPSLSNDLKPSTVPTNVKITYNYERDIPTKVRPHYRHAIRVKGNPPVTDEVAMGCPCQINHHRMRQDAWSEEEKKQFWSQLHLMMAERTRQEEEQQYTARKQEEREHNARAWQENRAIDGDAEDKVEAEMRAQREGGETAAESSAERAERDRQR